MSPFTLTSFTGQKGRYDLFRPSLRLKKERGVSYDSTSPVHSLILSCSRVFSSEMVNETSKVILRTVPDKTYEKDTWEGSWPLPMGSRGIRSWEGGVSSRVPNRVTYHVKRTCLIKVSRATPLPCVWTRKVP